MTRGKIIRKDILVVKDGATTGKTAFVSDSFPFSEVAVNEHVFILRVFENYIEPKYLFFWMQSPFGQQCVKDNFQGTAQGGINSLFIKNSNLPLAPLHEQHRIVVRIEELFTKLDAGIEALRKVKAQLRQYRQAVLKYAFVGKLTEEWRERYKDEIEPASVLLERIRKNLLLQGVDRQNKLKDKIEIASPLARNDNLSTLPDRWVWTELRNIAEFKNGINFNKHQKGNEGILTVDVLNMYSKGIFISMDELYRVNKSVNDDYLLKYGDILFVRSSVKREGVGWTSAFKEIGEPVTFCGFIIRARFRARQIFPEYITYFLRTDFAREIIISKGSQVTITNINQNSLGKILVPLAPTIEQHKIVEEISKRFSVTDDVDKVVEESIKQAERLRQSILKKAFEGKLVAQDPNDEPAEKLLERIRNQRK